jgi:Trypsin
VPHPDYNASNRDNDIMLVKIVGNSSAPLQTINFNSAVPPDDDAATVIGFGGKSSGLLATH